MESRESQSPSPAAALLHRLDILRRFNPDTARMARPDLLRLAEAAGAAAFPAAAAFAAELVADYEASPWKQAERAAVTEYLRLLENATRRLTAGGELEAGAVPPPATTTVSLVQSCLHSAMDWCRLQARADIPKRVLNSMEAARNRNRMVETVLETLFAVLHRLDCRQALDWELAFLEKRRGDIDADVVRDLLQAWIAEAALPAAALDWAMTWSADETLGRQWPVLVDRADTLLRREVLRAWQQADDGGTAAARHASLVLLRRRIGAGRLDEAELERWITLAVGEIGDAVHFFVTLSHAVETAGAEIEEWRREALLQEALRVCDLFEPVLLLADILLRLPGGASRFAMAFFGMGRSAEAEWRGRLEELARRNLRRLFLLGLRAGTPPPVTVERLCFGDRDLFRRLRLELDLGTGQFDSMRQRDRVVDALAVHYLNVREAELLGVELRRRYRALMRVLHADSLGRLLRPEQTARLGGRRGELLAELVAIAADARKFLARRRNLDEGVEERVAADLEFCQEIRRRRHVHLRRLLKRESALATA